MPALARPAEDLPGAGAVRPEQRPQQQVPLRAGPGGKKGGPRLAWRKRAGRRRGQAEPPGAAVGPSRPQPATAPVGDPRGPVRAGAAPLEPRGGGHPRSRRG